MNNKGRTFLPSRLLRAAICVVVLSASAFSASYFTLDSGRILLGGSAYGTPDYQTYIDFDISGRSLNPSRQLTFSANLPFSVYLDHPVQPQGDFVYTVVMPYNPNQLRINGEPRYPVWFNESVWTIRASAVTPEATQTSPAVIELTSPFTMSGITRAYGAYPLALRTRGSGTATIRLEKIEGRYFFREAEYTFETPRLLDRKDNGKVPFNYFRLSELR
ncbi:MAG: hypothetical protein KF762_06040 [Acidobacteria bacterium]|nr:hypothetical protein [Acidobacteriota bacterium]